MRRDASNGRMWRSRRSSRIASMRVISPSASSSYRSGWNARVVSRSSCANALATSDFPTPGGPWKRYACAGPSRSAASRSRAASGCSEKRANVLTDLRGDLFGGTGTFDGDDAVGLGRRERPVGAVDAAHELVALALDPVVVAPRAAARDGRVEQHEERAVRQQSVRHSEAQVAHAFLAERPAGALVGDRRVEIAVADDVLATLERGPDDACDVLGARGGVERRLRPGAHRLAVEDELAHRLADTRAARFAGRLPRSPLVAEPLGEQRGLGALARPVDSFEGYEHSIRNVGTDAGTRDRRCGLHRLEPGRRARRPRRRGDGRRQLRDRPARARESGGDAA